MSDTVTAAPLAPMRRKPEGGGNKTRVYCKLPLGLTLRLFRMVAQREQVLGGGTRDFTIAELDAEAGEVVIRGNAADRTGGPRDVRVVSDYAITEGVDAEFWDRWLEANKAMPAVVNGLIFASTKRDYGEDQARDFRDKLTGLEPIRSDIENDPRKPPSMPNVLRNAAPLEIARGERD